MPEDRKLPKLNSYPMLWLAASFAAGILAGSIANIDLRVSVAACAFFAIVAAIFRKHYFASYLIIIAFAAAGTASIQIEKLSVAPDRLRVLYDNGTIRSGDPVEIEGVLLGRPEPSMGGVFLNLRSEKIIYRGREQSVTGNVRLFLPMNEPETDIDLKYGSRLRIACKLERE